RAAVQFRQALDEREPHAETAKRAFTGHEELENALDIAGGDARALVRDLQQRRAALLLDANAHRLAGGREFERVVQEVCDDLLDARAVRIDPHRRSLKAQLVPLEAPRYTPDIHQPRHGFAEIQAFAVERELAEGDPADVQQIADQARH